MNEYLRKEYLAKQRRRGVPPVHGVSKTESYRVDLKASARGVVGAKLRPMRARLAGILYRIARGLRTLARAEGKQFS